MERQELDIRFSRLFGAASHQRPVTSGRGGSLEYFLPGSATAALALSFSNLGIFRIGKADDGSSQVKAQMYREKMLVE